MAGRNREQDRLRGQARGLRIVRRVVKQTIASLPGDDVENRALNIAVLGRHSYGLDLNFLNDVDARLGTRDACARTIVSRNDSDIRTETSDGDGALEPG